MTDLCPICGKRVAAGEPRYRRPDGDVRCSVISWSARCGAIDSVESTWCATDRVVFMTAHAKMDEDAAFVQDEGAPLLIKPFPREDLDAILARKIGPTRSGPPAKEVGREET